MNTKLSTCLDCRVLPPFSIALCPLHAAAERMRAFIASIACGSQAVTETGEHACVHAFEDSGDVDRCARARAILREIDGA